MRRYTVYHLHQNEKFYTHTEKDIWIHVSVYLFEIVVTNNFYLTDQTDVIFMEYIIITIASKRTVLKIYLS